MKKIKLFVFTLLAMFVAVVGVNAAENVVEVNSESSLANCLASGSQATTCKFTGDIEATGPIGLNRSVVLDFASHTLKFTGSNVNARLQVQMNGGGVAELRNGTIINDISGAQTAVSTFYQGNEIKFVGMNISAVDGAYPVLVNNTSSAHIIIDSSSTITAENHSGVANAGEAIIDVYGTIKSIGSGAAIEGNYYFPDCNTTINVYDGANISSTTGPGILQMSMGTVTVNGGTITGYSGIVMTKGDLVINGGNITGNGAYQAFSASANYKVNDNGAAVYVEPTVGMNVDINGGNLVSEQSYAFSAPATDDANDNLNISISGGNFDGAEDKGAIELEDDDREPFITGGQFSGMDHTHKDYLVSGYEYLDNGLVVTDADYTDLYATISVAKGYDLSKYTDESVKALLEAIEDAENVEQGLKSNEQYKINNLRNAIIAAIVNLVEKGDEPVGPGSSNPSNTDEKAPNTFDAGLVYMGLALSAIGTSIVSVRKLRNN